MREKVLYSKKIVGILHEFILIKLTMTFMAFPKAEKDNENHNKSRKNSLEFEFFICMHASRNDLHIK